jgi:hypothetical protein
MASTSMFGLIFRRYSFMTSTFEKPASFRSANACLVGLVWGLSVGHLPVLGRYCYLVKIYNPDFTDPRADQ